MKKKVLIIQGNPSKKSFCSALGKLYKEGAEKSGAEVKELILSDLNFNPLLSAETLNSQNLEPDLLDAQNLIKWAEHLVIIYPNWWGSMPALLKGFFDRTFTSKFAFAYRNNSLLWDKLLMGRSARIIVTMDTPKWFYYLFYQGAGHKVLKNNILEFCGINPVKLTIFSPIRKSDQIQRKNWLDSVYKIGLKIA